MASQAAGANGRDHSNGNNGIVYNNSNGFSTFEKKTFASSSAPLANDGKPPKTDRDGVASAFQQFGQLVHASKRPLPTQNGDGTYNEKKKHTGLRKDLKYIGWKG